MSLSRTWRARRALLALRNRLELVRAGLSRRELVQAGLLASNGLLIARSGLSARADGPPPSPPTTPFRDDVPLLVPPVKRPVPALTGPAPSIAPNRATNPATGLAFEGRTREHQAFRNYPAKFPFPPRVLFEVHQRRTLASVHPELPPQRLWGYDGLVPGPTYHARYGEQVLVRNFNDLPRDPGDNDGFGLNEVCTHLHNGHTPSESDGFPCDFFSSGQYYDQHYPNVLAGFASTHAPDGDPDEAMGTLWYHDHRIEFTAQNVYKGLAGFYLLFDEQDTGDERTGFRLPGVRDPRDFYAPVQFDVPLILGDRVFDPDTGQLAFDLFNLDGILGDKFLVNGRIQPFMEVQPRRYRFRVLNGGPSRFHQLFLTDRGANTALPFWQVSSDGNLLPAPVRVSSITLGVAERMDIVVDFRPFAGKRLYLENRLEQTNGRGPTGKTLPAGRGDFILQFRVASRSVEDGSLDPATGPRYRTLPAKNAAPRVTRTFRFDRVRGQWAVNNQLIAPTCDVPRFRVRRDSVEHWVLRNNSNGWQHPIHNHFEEFQILDRNGVAPAAGSVENARKDVVRLQGGEQVRLFSRFRDFEGRYPMHCHNVIHEDHAMMLRWDLDSTGDTNANP